MEPNAEVPTPAPLRALGELTLEQRLDDLEDSFFRARRRDSERLERATLMVMAFCLGFALAMELTS